MSKITLPTINAVILAIFLTGQAHANAPEFDFKAAAGYHYDSNVSVSELDTNTGEADNATLLEVSADSSVPVNDSLSVRLGYGYSQTSYQQYREFDSAVQRLQGDVAFRLGGFDTGLALRHFAARLDGERLLDIRQVSPHVARLLGKRVYLRGSFTNSKKQYADRSERNATNEALDLDVYLLLDGMRRYLAFGYRLDSEDAAATELDFDGTRARLAFGQRFDKLELKLRLQVEDRDYAHLNEEVGEARRDRRFRAGVDASYALSEIFSVEGGAQIANSKSNLPGAAFDETTYRISLAAAF